MGSWSEVETIALFPKRSWRGKQWLRVGICSFSKRVFVDLRECYRDEDSGDIKPTKKGITVNYTTLVELIDALNKAADVVSERYGGFFSDNPAILQLVERMRAGKPPFRARANDQTASTGDLPARLESPKQELELRNE